jgi:hypothetical protein
MRRKLTRVLPGNAHHEGLEGVGDASTNVADVTGAADDVPYADSFPTDSAN